eukprot:CAMPEP_0116822142 /NCGR_PEP_ID=MMETSP0418-20121206/103_1 /TAXON_ID=1158023 /ORGANISM="Astrosyne radiata, Strain 13vi08-1A" /LENGTH=51 /DNA_ID=CAMNT_0004450221 /DNA_START=478 /DNA_END=630 /DNA_ORIENTATION=-
MVVGSTGELLLDWDLVLVVVGVGEFLFVVEEIVGEKKESTQSLPQNSQSEW